MLQDFENKRGEIAFRRKLFQQQVQGERIFEDEFDSEGMERVLLERMAETERVIRDVREKGVRISPYLEVGAERGQRSLVLENELEERGAALDLSLDLLRSCTHYAQRFGRDRLPIRICADAYRLPFASDSLPFVFCFQTLHHFPSTAPVIAEIHRVLAPGGHFFFAEEPFRQRLHLPLVRRKHDIAHARSGRLRKLISRVFVAEILNEEEHGVLENHDIALREWRDALSVFESGTARIELDRISSGAFSDRNPVTFPMLWLLGGRISGLYRKAGTPGSCASTIADALAAPGGDADPIRRERDAWVSESGRRFPVIDGVDLLLPEETAAALYPEHRPL
jgi:SAM-dependent methyltransferase